MLKFNLFISRSSTKAGSKGRVANRLEPSLADDLRFRGRSSVACLSLVGFLALLDQGLHAGLQSVVVAHLLEGDLARFPEVLFALLLLVRPKLGDVGVVALGHVLGPNKN